jgi:UDP-N-acetylmuramoyl-L-alanyl-D-glutamate--2,6-diaminopimelate ligase
VGIAVAESIKDYRGIAADSRDVRPGFLFAALPGTKTDGARFIADAVNRGAVAVLGMPEAAEAARAHGVTFVSDSNPRRRLALMAAEFFAEQPARVAAVTGTNGKTSVVSFLRQIWTHLGHDAASLGTLGIDAPSGHVALAHTTPDPVKLHAQLAKLSQEGVDRLAVEASSHGLDQYRLDGVRVTAAGFTNITRDHLDYHTDFTAYFSAKMRLFTDLLAKDGVAVINADAPLAEDVAAIAAKRASQVLTVGEKGKAIRLLSRTPHENGQKIHLRHDGRDYAIDLPLVGEFQISNALIAAGLAIGSGESAELVFAALRTLKGAPGRMELVAFAKSGAPIYVDYAHTPDAMETALRALRPHVKGKLIIVFGCGGDRDRGKRPLMGEAACKFADAAIVTDDNPRGEDPAAIRREALAGCPGAREIGDRRAAIQAGIEMLSEGDTLILAGKGHEEGQIVGTEFLPYSERAEAVRIALALGGRAARDTRL